MVEFREAIKEDLFEVLEVMEETTYTQFFEGSYHEEMKKIFKECTIYLCIDKNDIVGYALFQPVGNRFKEKGIDVDKKFYYSKGIGLLKRYRGRGIETEFESWCEKKVSKKGAKGIYVDVGSKNKTSIKLQEKEGFTLIAEYATPEREEEKELNCVYGKIIH